MKKRIVWNLDPKRRGVLSAALSGANELFHPQAKQTHEIQEGQRSQGVQLGNEGDPIKITLKRPPAKPKD